MRTSFIRMRNKILLRPKRIILDLPLLAFAIIGILSILFSSDKPASIFGSYGIWHDGALAFTAFLFGTRFLAEKLPVQKFVPFLEQGTVVRWTLFVLPCIFVVASLLFWNHNPFSYGSGFRVAYATILDNPKNFVLGSGPATFSIDAVRYGFETARVPFAGEFIATLGLLGVGFLIVLYFILFYGSFALFKKRKGKIFPSLVFLMTALFILSSLVLPASFSLTLFFWITLFFGMVLLKGEKQYELSSAIEKYALSAVVFLLMAVLIIGFSMIVGAEWFSKKAERASGSTRISFLQRAVQIHPFESTYRVDLSAAYLEKFLEESSKPFPLQDKKVLAEHVTLATAYAREATLLSPNRSAVWDALGNIYREAQSIPGATEWAVQSFERAVSLHPSNVLTRVKLAGLYAKKGDTVKARGQLEQALQLNPFSVQANMELSLLLEQEGNIGEAVSVMERLVISFPNQESLLQLGRMYYNAKRYQDAIIQFEKVVAKDPANSNARYALALCYEGIGDTARAIQELQNVVQLNPENKNIEQKLYQLRQKTNSMQSF